MAILFRVFFRSSCRTSELYFRKLYFCRCVLYFVPSFHPVFSLRLCLRCGSTIWTTTAATFSSTARPSPSPATSCCPASARWMSTSAWLRPSRWRSCRWRWSTLRWPYWPCWLWSWSSVAAGATRPSRGRRSASSGGTASGWARAPSAAGAWSLSRAPGSPTSTTGELRSKVQERAAHTMVGRHEVFYLFNDIKWFVLRVIDV